MYQVISTDSLRPVNLYRFKELPASIQTSLAVSQMLEYDYEVGEAIEQWEGYAHFENSDVHAFVGRDVTPLGAHIGLYGTFALCDLWKICRIPCSPAPANDVTVTVPLPTYDGYGRLEGVWDTDARTVARLTSSIRQWWIDSKEEIWDESDAPWIAEKIASSMSDYCHSLLEYQIQSFTDDLETESPASVYTAFGVWYGFAEYDELIATNEEGTAAYIPQAEAVIRRRCKCLGYREDLNLDTMEECRRTQFTPSHEVWSVTDGDGRTVAYDLTTGRVCN